MKKKAQIKIKGLQVNGQTDDNIELITEGTYFKQDSGFVIQYKESEITGMEGTVTSISAEDNVVTITRRGTVNNQFVFDQGKNMKSYYDTPYGSFLMNIISKKVNVNLSEEGGNLNVVYNLNINGSNTGENNLSLFVRIQ
ncbi:MAG: DUF1934 domain-containing protein [Clostridiales bacterium]|jgi:uncharacterized beta-barrel protein YwiB (DUF1934 family)|nr:DUF1934 domain-containing protein [Clostridiales bacterium]